MGCSVAEIAHGEQGFELRTSQGLIRAAKLVVATGGMAIPQLGATDFGLKIARQFGLKIVEPRPALVPLTFDAAQWQPLSALSGVALEVSLSTGRARRAANSSKTCCSRIAGCRGRRFCRFPAIGSRASPSWWTWRRAVTWPPSCWMPSPATGSSCTVLAGLWPKRLADAGWRWRGGKPGLAALRLADAPDKTLRGLAQDIHQWTLTPSGTAGYKKAEVMRGGVDTRGLDQKSMQARTVPGLYFIGEAVDVTGWLGGYNWAWASGVACGKAL